MRIKPRTIEARNVRSALGIFGFFNDGGYMKSRQNNKQMQATLYCFRRKVLQNANESRKRNANVREWGTRMNANGGRECIENGQEVVISFNL
jgi:hypothetical protein